MRECKRFVHKKWSSALLVLLQQQRNLQAVAVGFAVVLLAPFAWGQELTAASFKSTYGPAAAKLEEVYSTCSAKIIETRIGQENRAEIKVSFVFDGEQRKFDRTITDTKDGEMTSWTRSIVASPEVSFMVLTKHASGPLLEQVNRSNLGFVRATNSIKEQACDSIYSPFAFLGRRVSAWLVHPGFQIKNVTRNGERVRLEFACIDKKDEREHRGWVDFLPDRQWVIDGWEIAITITGAGITWTNATQVKYGSDDPVPRMLGMDTVEHHNTGIVTKKTTVQELTFQSATKDEFLLSTYGYDDRIGLPARMIDSFWFWTAIVGIICLVAATAIRYRLKAA